MERERQEELVVRSEIVAIIRGRLPDQELAEKLHDYHEHDIAQSLDELTKKERIRLYHILGPEWISGIVSFMDDPD